MNVLYASGAKWVPLSAFEQHVYLNPAYNGLMLDESTPKGLWASFDAF